MANGYFKDLTRRTASDKMLRDKAFNNDGLQTFWEKASGSNIKNEIISNKELAEELHKPIIRKFIEKYTQLL